MPWLRITTLLLLGYFCMGRSFAYLGIPALHLFPGELVLALFFLFGPRVGRSRWICHAMSKPVLYGYKRALFVFLIFGCCQALRGIYLGHPPLLAARDLALNYYPFYFFLGLWAGLLDAGYLEKFFRTAAWANGIYGVLFIFLLSRLHWSFIGFSQAAQPVQVFGPPEFSAVILLGLLSFEKHLRRVWPLLFLNAAVLLGMLIRAEWAAFALGLLIWAWNTRNLKRLALAGATPLLILVFIYFTNLTIPGPEMRGGTISPTELIARIIAPISSDVAAQYASDDADLGMYEGTALWRIAFWTEIWRSVHASTWRALTGYGYGYPLNDLVPEIAGDTTRTPHNVFFLVLAYTGWIGVTTFAALQAALARLLWKAHRERGEAFGIVCWAALTTFAMFTPFFEAPHGAIPFYLLAGSACARLLHGERDSPAVAMLLRATNVRTSSSVSHGGMS
jgi:hypothetical protein